MFNTSTGKEYSILVVALCSLERTRRFRGTHCAIISWVCSLLLLVFCMIYCSAVNMEAACSVETSSYRQTTRRYNPEDSTRNNNHHDNLLYNICRYLESQVLMLLFVRTKLSISWSHLSFFPPRSALWRISARWMPNLVADWQRVSASTPRTISLPLQIFELLFFQTNKRTQVFVGQILGFKNLTYILCFIGVYKSAYCIYYFCTLDGVRHLVLLIVVDDICLYVHWYIL